MDWIFDHFQIVVVIAVVLGSLVKRVLEAKAEPQGNSESEDPGDIFGPDENWKPERPRPSPSVPPPLARTVPPPLVRVAMPPPQVAETDVVLKRQQDMQERLRQIKEAKPATNPMQPRAKRTAPAGSKTTLRGALRGRGEIRRAILMKEILGPPPGLR